MSRFGSRTGAVPALAGAVLALLTDVLYLAIIRGQDTGEPGDWARVSVVAGVILALATCAGVAALAAGVAPPLRKVLLGIATVGLFVMGVLGLMSIGLPLLGAALLCLTGWLRVTPSSAVAS